MKVADDGGNHVPPPLSLDDATRQPSQVTRSATCDNVTCAQRVRTLEHQVTELARENGRLQSQLRRQFEEALRVRASNAEIALDEVKSFDHFRARLLRSSPADKKPNDAFGTAPSDSQSPQQQFAPQAVSLVFGLGSSQKSPAPVSTSASSLPQPPQQHTSSSNTTFAPAIPFPSASMFGLGLAAEGSLQAAPSSSGGLSGMTNMPFLLPGAQHHHHHPGPLFQLSQQPTHGQQAIPPGMVYGFHHGTAHGPSPSLYPPPTTASMPILHHHAMFGGFPGHLPTEQHQHQHQQRGGGPGGDAGNGPQLQASMPTAFASAPAGSGIGAQPVKASPVLRSNPQLLLQSAVGVVTHPGDNAWRTCVFAPALFPGTAVSLDIMHLDSLSRLCIGVVTSGQLDRVTRDNTFVGTVGIGTRNDYARCNRKDIRPVSGGSFPNVGTAPTRVRVSIDFAAQQLCVATSSANSTSSAVFDYPATSNPPLIAGDAYVAVSLQSGGVVRLLD